ncbi:hypothetical protein O152_gp049 [Pseudomonas phage PaBG]|uniref:Uncharacterized protein n=1 Tax=Pseudomonas phage PaBG TaxID=1335230 RepID=S5WB24_9CAUD|nr:hypothetical protein O152_gp049 [Pseudomonas phage PaBG]AGS81933.1 hypothetical protein PaBG_00049 [Pseudomonas phage PaBG]
MAEFMSVPGFIVYKNRVHDGSQGREGDLTRDIIQEVEDEEIAKRIVAEELAKDPTADPNWIYYEEGTILV